MSKIEEVLGGLRDRLPRRKGRRASNFPESQREDHQSVDIFTVLQFDDSIPSEEQERIKERFLIHRDEYVVIKSDRGIAPVLHDVKQHIELTAYPANYFTAVHVRPAYAKDLDSLRKDYPYMNSADTFYHMTLSTDNQSVNKHVLSGSSGVYKMLQNGKWTDGYNPNGINYR